MTTTTMVRVVMGAALAVGLAGPVLAQGAASGQVSGDELRGWIQADGFVIGALNVVNGCYYMARSTGDQRVQAIFCPGREPFISSGEAKVVGNQLCSKYSYPDGSRTDQCAEVFKVGDNRYEIRVDGKPRGVFHRVLR